MLQSLVGDEGGHAGLAVGARNRHAVDVGLLDARKRAERHRHLGGRDVLALPAERVADAVDEIEIASLVPSHQIAGTKPGVAGCEHVPQDLLLGGIDAGVALEPAGDVRRAADDLADRFADFVRSTANAKALLVSDGLFTSGVEPDQRRRESMGEKGWDAANRAGFALEIEERDVALGRGVELENPGNAETVLEVVPDVGPQPVTAAHPEPVPGLVRLRLRVQQIAAKLADVLEQRALPPDDVWPEVTGRELVADHHRAAPDQDRAGGQNTTDAVIERQAVVHPIGRPGVHETGEPMTPLHQSSMADPGGLREPGGARRVNEERGLVDRHGSALGLAQRAADKSLDVAVEAGKYAGPVAV